MGSTRRWKTVALLSSLTLATICFARQRETGFLDRIVTMKGEVFRYQVYVPQNFDSQKHWPVILFLHGSGERGDKGILPTDVGIAHAIRAVTFTFSIRGRHSVVSKGKAPAALDQSVRFTATAIASI